MEYEAPPIDVQRREAIQRATTPYSKAITAVQFLSVEDAKKASDVADLAALEGGGMPTIHQIMSKLAPPDQEVDLDPYELVAALLMIAADLSGKIPAFHDPDAIRTGFRTS